MKKSLLFIGGLILFISIVKMCNSYVEIDEKEEFLKNTTTEVISPDDARKVNDEKNKLPSSFYEIISEKNHVDARFGFNKCNIEIELKDKITYNQLKFLAIDLRKNRKSYDRLWIFYNIKGRKHTAAWATTHFTPSLNIWINENY